MKDRNFDFIFLGAEKQAACSFALTFPEKQFLFLTDQPVVPGWDLPNVIIEHCMPDHLNELQACHQGTLLSLSSRYSSSIFSRDNHDKVSLFSDLTKIYQSIPDVGCLIVKEISPFETKEFILKGDFWHRPDATERVVAGKDRIPDDPYGCGLFFQEYFTSIQHIITTGRIYEGCFYHGSFSVFRESNARESNILACETISEPSLSEISDRIIKLLNYKSGFLTFNWIKTEERIILTSVRNEPVAVSKAMHHAGINLLEPEKSTGTRAAAGIRMVADVHYANYETFNL